MHKCQGEFALRTQFLTINALYKGVPIDGNVTSVIKPFTPHREMDRSLYLHSLTRKFRQCIYCYGSKLLNHRAMSMTAAMDSPTLPLAGIRVLDMTRVLAGVCRPWFSYKNDYTDIHTLQPYATQILGDLG